MFDLETAIREWKKEFGKYESFEDGQVADMELHLRDSYEAMKAEGLHNEAAFAKAVAQVGTAATIAAEYHKNRELALDRRAPWRPARFIPGLLWNYAKTAARRARMQKTYALINVLGLAVSLACVLLMLFHVGAELSYEKCFPKSGRIFRVQTDSVYGSNTRNWATSAPALGPKLKESFPEIVDAARIMRIGESVLSTDDGARRHVMAENGFLADPSFLTLFDLGVLRGDPISALGQPGKIVLSRSLAEKLFPGEDPMGKVLAGESGGKRSLQVAGVIQELPRNSFLKVDYLISMSTLPIVLDWPDALDHRTWKTMQTFVLLRPGLSPAWFKEKAPGFMKVFQAKVPGRNESLRLQPIRSIHLHSKLEGEIEPNSDIIYVYIFAAAALLLLLIAGVNFVNLATAQAFRRTKEIGMRKVLGAGRGQLIRQFLGETFLTTLAAFACSLGLLVLALPLYNRMSGKALRFADIMTAENAALGLGLAAILSILSGLYPAFIASGFRIGNSLKSNRPWPLSTSRLRRVLVVFQFGVSIFIILGTLAIRHQLDFCRGYDLGFAKDSLLAMNLNDDTQGLAAAAGGPLKNEIRRHSGVSGVALASHLPGMPFSSEHLTPVHVKDRSTLPILRVLRVDEDFIATAGLTLVRGQNFQGPTRQYIISETTQAMLDLKQPLGIKCRSDLDDREAPIVGVIKDFHFASLHSPIEPLVLEYSPAMTQFLLVKIRPGQNRTVLEFLRRKFREIAPRTLFRYRFLSDVFDRNYDLENRVFLLFKVFSIIAIAIACLGLFGLAALAAESRVKEIGIRKMLGASGANLAGMLSSEFLRLVLAANLLAWPLAYIAIRGWLNKFAYRSSISVWTFLLASLAAFSLALLAVGLRVAAATRANPVDSLRYE
jgi:putative ABC transport system permease protein